MKTIIFCFIFSFLVAGVTAQDTKLTNNHNTEITNDASSESSEALKLTNTLEEDTCYSEISKVTFYEALIRQNNFDIKLEHNDLALKNTEQIINNSKQRISYSE